MKTVAHDLHVMLVGFLRHVGPDATSIGLQALGSHDLMRVGVSSNSAVDTLAFRFGLDAPTTERHGSVSWTQATGEEGRLRVVVTGPHLFGSPDSDGTVGGKS